MKINLTKSECFVLVLTLLFAALVLGVQFGRAQTKAVFSVSEQPRAESAASASAAPAETQVDLNTASAEELETLNGVGEVLAQRIVDYRAENGAFASVEDITKVPGIGISVYEKNLGRMTVK